MLGEAFFNTAGVYQGGEDESAFLVVPGAPRAGWIGLRYNFGAKQSVAANDND